MTSPNFDPRMREFRNRRWRCVLGHALVLGALVLLFSLTGRLLKGFDWKHLFAELVLLYLAVAFHLCTERLLRRYERLTRQLTNARDSQ